MIEEKDSEKLKNDGNQEKSWFHVCSQGLEGVDLFPDEAAFIAGINKFAVAFKLFDDDVEVVILVLVSNHFHSLVYGRRKDVTRCCYRYKKIISMYYSHRFGTSKVMGGVRVKIERIDTEEYLKNVIGYILNNPRKHHETNNPFSYPWSSILEYFDTKNLSAVVQPKVIDAPQWYKAEVFGTSRPVPRSWEMQSNGMVTFRSFINPTLLEAEVKTVTSLSYLVNKADLSSSQGEVVNYRDNDLAVRNVVARICPKLFPGAVKPLVEPESAPVRNTGFCLKEREKTICWQAEEMISQLDLNQVESLRTILAGNFGFPTRIVNRVLRSKPPWR